LKQQEQISAMNAHLENLQGQQASLNNTLKDINAVNAKLIKAITTLTTGITGTASNTTSVNNSLDSLNKGIENFVQNLKSNINTTLYVAITSLNDGLDNMYLSYAEASTQILGQIDDIEDSNKQIIRWLSDEDNENSLVSVLKAGSAQVKASIEKSLAEIDKYIADRINTVVDEATQDTEEETSEGTPSSEKSTITDIYTTHGMDDNGKPTKYKTFVYSDGSMYSSMYDENGKLTGGTTKHATFKGDNDGQEIICIFDSNWKVLGVIAPKEQQEQIKTGVEKGLATVDGHIADRLLNQQANPDKVLDNTTKEIKLASFSLATPR
jgi:hypothetical protein